MSDREALSAGVRIGSRLPAHATAMGKVLLSSLHNEELGQRFGQDRLDAYTNRTITTVAELRGALAEVRRQGFALDEEEYELAVRAAACPLTTPGGELLAGMNVSMRTARLPRIDFLGRTLPALLRTAADVAADTTWHESAFSPEKEQTNVSDASDVAHVPSQRGEKESS